MSDLFESSGVAVTVVKQPDLLKWSHYMSQDNSDEIDDIMNEVVMLRIAGTTIYPDQENVLRIFRELSPDKVKVVILGQDPYHDGNATGVAFACKNKVSPSLLKMVEAMRRSNSKMENFNKNLEYLVKQGVMLINTTLTVEKGIAGSHLDLNWAEVVKDILVNLSNKNKNIVFMLWGGYARTFKTYFDPQVHFILEYTHPASASYGATRWNCTHFNEANEYLVSNGKEPIVWI